MNNNNPTSNNNGQSTFHLTGTYSEPPQGKTAVNKEDHTFISTANQLKKDDEIELKNQQYKILEVISHDTAEAIIYKVRDFNGEIKVLKLYHEFPENRKKEEPSHVTLSRIKEILHPRVLPLYDFGVQLTEKYQGKYCFEISKFAEGGDLLNVASLSAKFNNEFLTKTIIPQLFAAIKKFHDEKIYHCDIKPSNIFFIDKAQSLIVLGDYGSAKAYELDIEKTLTKTSTVKGTEFYISPEQAQGLVSPKNDYYSFGKVLLHLLYSQQLCETNNYKVVSKINSDRIIENGSNGVPLINYDNGYGRINQLIAGLTLNNLSQRWGKNEVDRWLKGEDVQVIYNNADKNQSTLKINLTQGRKASTLHELSEFIKSDSNWYNEIIQDDPTKRTIYQLIDHEKGKDLRLWVDTLIRSLNEDESVFASIQNGLPSNAFLREALLWIFTNNRSLTTEMGQLQFPVSGNIVDVCSSIINNYDQIWKAKEEAGERILPLFHLEMWLLIHIKCQANQLIQEQAKTLLDKMYEGLGITSNSEYTPKIINRYFKLKEEEKRSSILIDLAYKFNSNRSFKGAKNEEYSNIESVALYLAKNDTQYDTPELKAERICFLSKKDQLTSINLSLRDLLFKVYTEKAESRIEIESVDFDKAGEYTVKYRYFKSLANFFASQGVLNSNASHFVSGSNNLETYNATRGFFTDFSSPAYKFISEVSKKYNISQIPSDNKFMIVDAFQEGSKKSFRKHYTGQILAAIIIIPLAFVTYFHAVDFLQNNNFIYSTANAVEEYSIIGHAFVKSQAANMRSGASKNHSVVQEIYRGQKVDIISRGHYDQNGNEWLYVAYLNSYGYMSSSVLDIIIE